MPSPTTVQISQAAKTTAAIQAGQDTVVNIGDLTIAGVAVEYHPLPPAATDTPRLNVLWVAISDYTVWIAKQDLSTWSQVGSGGSSDSFLAPLFKNAQGQVSIRLDNATTGVNQNNSLYAKLLRYDSGDNPGVVYSIAAIGAVLSRNSEGELLFTIPSFQVATTEANSDTFITNAVNLFQITNSSGWPANTAAGNFIRLFVAINGTGATTKISQQFINFNTGVEWVRASLDNGATWSPWIQIGGNVGLQVFTQEANSVTFTTNGLSIFPITTSQGWPAGTLTGHVITLLTAVNGQRITQQLVNFVLGIIYLRTSTNGGAAWTNWLQIGGGTGIQVITSEVNPNTMNSNNIWFFTVSDISRPNLPQLTSNGDFVKIETTVNGQIIGQEFFNISTAASWSRRSTNGGSTWQSWGQARARAAGYLGAVDVTTTPFTILALAAGAVYRATVISGIFNLPQRSTLPGGAIYTIVANQACTLNAFTDDAIIDQYGNSSSSIAIPAGATIQIEVGASSTEWLVIIDNDQAGNNAFNSVTDYTTATAALPASAAGGASRLRTGVTAATLPAIANLAQGAVLTLLNITNAAITVSVASGDAIINQAGASVTTISIPAMSTLEIFVSSTANRQWSVISLGVTPISDYVRIGAYPYGSMLALGNSTGGVDIIAYGQLVASFVDIQGANILPTNGLSLSNTFEKIAVNGNTKWILATSGLFSDNNGDGQFQVRPGYATSAFFPLANAVPIGLRASTVNNGLFAMAAVGGNIQLVSFDGVNVANKRVAAAFQLTDSAGANATAVYDFAVNPNLVGGAYDIFVVAASNNGTFVIRLKMTTAVTPVVTFVSRDNESGSSATLVNQIAMAGVDSNNAIRLVASVGNDSEIWTKTYGVSTWRRLETQEISLTAPIAAIDSLVLSDNTCYAVAICTDGKVGYVNVATGDITIDTIPANVTTGFAVAVLSITNNSVTYLGFGSTGSTAVVWNNTGKIIMQLNVELHSNQPAVLSEVDVQELRPARIDFVNDTDFSQTKAAVYKDFTLAINADTVIPATDTAVAFQQAVYQSSWLDSSGNPILPFFCTIDSSGRLVFNSPQRVYKIESTILWRTTNTPSSWVAASRASYLKSIVSSTRYCHTDALINKDSNDIHNGQHLEFVDVLANDGFQLFGWTDSTATFNSSIIKLPGIARTLVKFYFPIGQ